MTDEAPKPENENPDTEPDNDEAGEETEEEESAPSAEDFKKLQEKASRREAALRKAQKELAELKKPKEPDEEEDKVAKANRRLLTASARTVLTAAGIADRDDQKLVLSLIDLSGIEIDEEDGPDEDAIEEKISDLRRIFGATSKPDAPGSRKPRGVRTADRGGNGTVDADTARYRRIIGAK